MIGTISSAGVGSGLDIQSLVTQLVAAERAPTANRLSRQESEARVELSAYGVLRSALSGLQSSIDELVGEETTAARTGSVSDEDVLGLTASAGSALGSFEVEVLALAQTGRLSTTTPLAAETALGSGSLDIDLGSDSFSVSITDPLTTLAELRDAINNATDNPGVTASLIQVDAGEVLTLSSDRIGSDSQINVVGNGDLATFAADLGTTVIAQDAQIEIDGFLVTRGSNTVDDAIAGVSLQLLEARPGELQSITVSRDGQTQAERFADLVTAWNKFTTTADQLSSFDPTSSAAGPLNGDALLRGIEARLQRALGNSYEGAQAADFGLSFDSQGQLQLDTEALNTAIANNPDSLTDWWQGETGLGSTLQGLLDDMLGEDSGLSGREDGLQSRLDRIELANERLDLRMERVELRYRRQFTALDVALAQMQQTSGFLSQQLASLPGFSQQ